MSKLTHLDSGVVIGMRRVENSEKTWKLPRLQLKILYSHAGLSISLILSNRE